MPKLTGITNLSGIASLSIPPLLDYVDLAWTPDATKDRTLIVMKTGSAPSSHTDGQVVYLGKESSTRINQLASGTTYHFAYYGVDTTYSLGTETTQSITGNTYSEGMFIAASEQYLFVPQPGGIGVYSLDDVTTLLTTIAPASIGSDVVVRVSCSGSYVGFNTATHAYLYKYTSASTYTKIYEDNLPGDNMRACYVDDEQEYFYYCATNGDIHYIDIATQTKTTNSAIHSDNVRQLAAFGNDMISVSNDDTAKRIDRTNRLSMTATTLTSLSVNVEAGGIDSEYIWYGSDTTQVVILNKSDNSSAHFLNDPTDDITGTDRNYEHFAVSCDNGRVYIYDTENSFTRLTTIVTGYTLAECVLMKNGTMYYVGNGASDALISRPYLTTSNHTLITSSSVSV